LPRVAIDPAELREVLLNLLFNAADAMPDGGRIEISTRPSRAPGAADLEVRDTGHGMPESVRARIFEPFYSTKGAKGSGLGLAVAYSIISRRGGDIAVDSEVGKGTTFTLRLPYVPTASLPQSAPATPRQESPPEKRSPRATPPGVKQALEGTRILVADDEPGLVTIVRQLMERSGARVTIANGGRAALDALRDPAQSFEVVITDLDMPEVDGWAVTAEAKARRADVRVIMLTGWAGEIAPEDFSARGVDVVLGKPCSRADLESAISQLLAPPARPDGALDVLLVDDQLVFARSIRDLLKLQGHRVDVVDSARAALDAVSAKQFDAVLTDYSLGEVSGAQLAERLAERASTLADGARAPFVVLITGYATEVDDPSLLSRGVDAVLPKPCRGEDLRAVLERVPRPSTRPLGQPLLAPRRPDTASTQ
jgi:CheY-like chemotaxis protein